MSKTDPALRKLRIIGQLHRHLWHQTLTGTCTKSLSSNKGSSAVYIKQFPLSNSSVSGFLMNRRDKTPSFEFWSRNHQFSSKTVLKVPLCDPGINCKHPFSSVASFEVKKK